MEWSACFVILELFFKGGSFHLKEFPLSFRYFLGQSQTSAVGIALVIIETFQTVKFNRFYAVRIRIDCLFFLKSSGHFYYTAHILPYIGNNTLPNYRTSTIRYFIIIIIILYLPSDFRVAYAANISEHLPTQP